MNPKDLNRLFPQWQFSIREAAEILKTPLCERTDADIEKLNARVKDSINGRNLHFVLTKIFGIPVVTPSLKRNYYTVDGYWFAIKTASSGNDDRQPVYAASSNAKPSQAAVTFTLYVGKVIVDPTFDGWPDYQVLVGRNVHLYNANYTRIRADLMGFIEQLDAEYQAVIPHYEAWKALQLVPDEQQDMFMQLIRRALREMPKREVVQLSEPVDVMQAVLQDSIAEMDGLRLDGKGDEPTLAALEAKANDIIALLDDLLPPNYEPFDPTDAPDEDEYEEDDTDLDDDYPDEEEAGDLYLEDGDEDFDGEDESQTPSPDVDYHDLPPELNAPLPEPAGNNRPLTELEVRRMFAAMDYADEVS